jgi:hypothetical protein
VVLTISARRYYLRGVDRVAAWLILVVMVIYGLISLDFAFKQNWSMAIVWGGYCVSNWGLYLISMKG